MCILAKHQKQLSDAKFGLEEREICAETLIFRQNHFLETSPEKNV